MVQNKVLSNSSQKSVIKIVLVTSFLCICKCSKCFPPLYINSGKTHCRTNNWMLVKKNDPWGVLLLTTFIRKCLLHLTIKIQNYITKIKVQAPQNIYPVTKRMALLYLFKKKKKFWADIALISKLKIK